MFYRAWKFKTGACFNITKLNALEAQQMHLVLRKKSFPWTMQLQSKVFIRI